MPTLPIAPSPPRPLEKRPDYQPRLTQERFIVPLLGENILRAIDQWLPAPKGARVLDVGCGRQPFRKQLEAAGFAYFSIDAVQMPEASVDFIAPVDGDLPESLLALAPFDAILCTEVLEHVAGWEQAFLNFSRLLRPGGRAIITAPHVYPLHEEPYDFWRPTPHTLNHFSQKYGFNMLELSKLGDGADVIGTLCACCRPMGAGRGLIGAFLGWVLNQSRRAFLFAALSPYVRSRVSFIGPLYISNLAVIERKP